MEFDDVVIMVSQSEHFLQHYLPEAISRCTFDLTLVLLPKENENTKEGFLQKFSKFFSGARDEKTRETVANMIEEFKRASLVKQLVLAEYKSCEKSFCYSSNETDNKEMFQVHTHLDQYKKHIESYVEFEKLQRLDTSDDSHTDARYVL